MALSNIFREPRREIIESGVGIMAAVAGVGGGIGAAYFLARWWVPFVQDTPPSGGDIAVGTVLTILGMGPAWLLLEFTHWLGERVCGALQERGVHLRPRNRPNR